jgi:SAM-dependent methyltransferase
LPIKSWFNLTTLLHIHLHSKYSGNNESKEIENKNKKGFTLEKIRSLQKMIFRTVSTWNKSHQFKNHWSAYYENDIESQEYLNDKEVTIRKWLEIIKPKLVLDLGANTGKFSFIAAEYAERVISIEADQKCVDEIEDKISMKNGNVFTLTGNVAEPSPTLGLLNIETDCIYIRAKTDLLLGLALVHHLYINNRLNFNQITLIFAKFSTKYLIVEFIPFIDNKVQLLIKERGINLMNYTEVEFTNALSSLFTIKESFKLKESNRKLFLLEKKVDIRK